MKIILCLLLVVCFCSCARRSETEKLQKERNNIIDVSHKVQKIELEQPFGSVAWPVIIGDHLIIGDYYSYDKVVHLFNKNDFSYITSTAEKGQGPGEIARIGNITVDEENRIFYVNDYGKNKIYGFSLDSVLENPFYLPEEKTTYSLGMSASKYKYMSDTFSICVTIEPQAHTFQQSVAKFNLNTGEVIPMKYEHPEIERRRISAAGSFVHGIYVECFEHHDLMTIYTLDGELKYNIYGRRWNNERSNRTCYYGDVMFCKDKIIALYYDGIDHYVIKDGRETTNNPRNMIVFDTEGEYLQTLLLDCNIISFCYDKENNRICMLLDEEVQFGYLDLDGII